MIQVKLTNEILKRITAIEKNRFSFSTVEMPTVIHNRLRNNSKKKSSYASNKIEGNPLTEPQANEVLERDAHNHFLKPEQEIRNYFMALSLLEEKLKETYDLIELTDGEKRDQRKNQNIKYMVEKPACDQYRLALFYFFKEKRRQKLKKSAADGIKDPNCQKQQQGSRTP